MQTAAAESVLPTVDSLTTENNELRRRLEEAEETIRAIQQGAVDAFVLEESSGHRVYTLESADRPYRLFVEEMQQGVATLDADGTIVYGNRRLADMLGVPHEKLIGIALRQFVSAIDLPVFDHLLQKGRSQTGQGEARLIGTKGTRIPAYLTFNPLPKGCGALIGVFITDLTTQKHHEELAVAQEALRESDRRKSEFLAMLAHELRNPLAPIRNAVNILRLTVTDNAQVQTTSAMLERQVGQMIRLVDDLLDVSRISRGKIELRRERIELTSVLSQAIECIRPLCASMGHELRVALPSEPVLLEGDPIRLTQVFINLLDNACKYMGKNGWIRVSTEFRDQGLGVRGQESREVVIRIADGGIGIAADHLNRIFDMFAQVDTSLERSHSGLGIGLTLVKSLVEMHGGRVEAHSDGPGKGSEFVVYLPVVVGADTPSQPKPTTPHDARKCRILVVDDNRDSAESLAMLLKLKGHETHTAFDGATAMNAAEKLRPNVMLLDIGMPRLNGYDVCRQIRSQPWGKDMVLIAQTGWGQEDDKRRTEEAGFNGHLVKPVDQAALSKLFASLLPAGSAG